MHCEETKRSVHVKLYKGLKKQRERSQIYLVRLRKKLMSVCVINCVEHYVSLRFNSALVTDVVRHELSQTRRISTVDSTVSQRFR